MELDEVLSQATELASHLNEQLGAADRPSTSPPPDPITEAKASTLDSLECELHELERLVAATTQEIGSAAPEAGSTHASAPVATLAPVSPVDAPANDESSAYVMPDFMSEFTQPEAKPAPVEKQTPASQSHKAPASKPGVVSTPKVGVVGEPSPEFMEAALPASADQADGPSPSRLPKPAAAPHRRSVVEAVSPVAVAICAHAVRLLEAIDRPFSRIGIMPRRFAGWLALATLGTAAMVYVLSLW